MTWNVKYFADIRKQTFDIKVEQNLHYLAKPLTGSDAVFVTLCRKSRDRRITYSLYFIVCCTASASCTFDDVTTFWIWRAELSDCHAPHTGIKQALLSAQLRGVVHEDGRAEINGRGGPGRGAQSRLILLGPASSLMWTRWLLPVLWALSAEADFFQLDSISNVSTYYFNYFYCNIWEGDCQPNQDDATQQGKAGNAA